MPKKIIAIVSSPRKGNSEMLVDQFIAGAEAAGNVTEKICLRECNINYCRGCGHCMMARWEEKLFPVLEELNIGFVAYSPLANGILSDAYQGQNFTGADDFRSFMPQYQANGHEQNAPFLQLVRELAEEKQATPAQISLAWMLGKKPYIVPIPGSRKLERLAENAKAAEIVLTEAEVQKIDHAIEALDVAVFGGLPKSLERRWDE